MSKILALLSGCSMTACALGSVLAIAAQGLLSMAPTVPAPEPKQPAPAPKAPVTPTPKPAPKPQPQPRNPRSPH